MSGLELPDRQSFHPKWIILSGLFIILLGLGAWVTYRYYTTGDLPLGVTVNALQADPDVDESELSENAVSSHSVAADEPRYIRIPSIGVEVARVFGGGVDKNNILMSPSHIDDAMWYQKSAKPGQGYGAVLINGHNGGTSRDGIFAKLSTLKEGDTIELERGDGETLRYRVVSNQSMSLEQVNKSGMQMMGESATQGEEGLNIITCDGKWVPVIKQFDRRIMLRAVLTD